MNEATKPAPFNVGDHVRYVGSERHELPAGQGNGTEPVLAPGMEGVVLLSSGALSDQGMSAPNPWHCKVQFKNGYQFDISPENVADFEPAYEDASTT